MLPALALAVALVAAWGLARGPDVAEEGDVVARGPAGEDAPGPLLVEPVLRGAADARPAPAADERAGPDRDPLGWRITFESVGMDGTPLAWELAAFRDARGAPREHVRAPGDATTGFLDVTGEGRLVVEAEGFVPWASGWLARPVAGTLHVVARLDPGLAVAGEVFEQDGRTPLAAGSVLVFCNGGALPDGTSFGQQGEVADGRFRVTGLAPGPVEVRVGARRSPAGQPVRIQAEAGDEDLRIVLGPWGRITLLLVDERTGFAPVTTYLQVFDVDDDGDAFPRLTTSTTAPAEGAPPTPLGGFDAAPGARVRFRVEAQGYEPSDVFEVVVPAVGRPGRDPRRAASRAAKRRARAPPAPGAGRAAPRARAGRASRRRRQHRARLPRGGRRRLARARAGHAPPGRGRRVSSVRTGSRLGAGPGPTWSWRPARSARWTCCSVPAGGSSSRGAPTCAPRPSGGCAAATRARSARATTGWARPTASSWASSRPAAGGSGSSRPRGGDRTATVEVRAGEVVRVDPAALAPVGDEDPRRGRR